MKTLPSWLSARLNIDRDQRIIGVPELTIPEVSLAEASELQHEALAELPEVKRHPENAAAPVQPILYETRTRWTSKPVNLISATCTTFLLSLLSLGTTQAQAAESSFSFQNYAELAGLFDELGYTQQAWEAGIREVPRVIVVEVPSRWRGGVADSLEVADKKRIFFRMLGPLVLIANERIGEDRSVLLDLIARHENGDTLTAGELSWLQDLAVQYKVTLSEPISTEALAALLKRVDIVPPSLAMAQSAEESGWGTSRFADLGNALFGQWTWSGGIEPLQKRTDKGDYGIARFDTPLDSVEAYMRNLNTHPAYAELRERRAEMHAAHKRPNGYELARSLTRYSERGEAYVDSLHAIMRVNKLQPADEAFLGAGRPLLLVPVDSESPVSEPG